MDRDSDDYSEFVEKLIDAVREHSCIYDKKHIAYFNRSEREKSWQEIAQQLGKDVEDCQRRWKLLREKLAKELKKRDRALELGEPYESDWTCFDKIIFIEDHIAPRRKYESFKQEVSEQPLNLCNNGDNNNSSQEACVNQKITPKAKKRRSAPTTKHKVNTNNSDFPTFNQHDLNRIALFKFQHNASDANDDKTAIKTEPMETAESTPHNNTTIAQLSSSSPLIVGKCSRDSFEKDDAETICNDDEDGSSCDETEEQPINMVKDTSCEESHHNSNSILIKPERDYEQILAQRLLRDNADELFGKLVVLMLKGIDNETSKDDVKLQIMQLLINAKRINQPDCPT